MDSVIFTLYNYASNQREEYLLLRLFKTALQEEIKCVVWIFETLSLGSVACVYTLPFIALLANLKR